MEQNLIYIIISEIKYNNGTKKEPLIMKLNNKEHAILAWDKKVKAEKFLSERKLINYSVIGVDDNYLQEQVKKYEKNNLILKINKFT
jgi:fructose-specific phosphotransferase system component IIB